MLLKYNYLIFPCLLTDLDKIIISYTTPNAVNTIVIDKLIMNSFLNSLTFINSLKASIPLYDKLSSLAISFTYST